MHACLHCISTMMNCYWCANVYYKNIELGIRKIPQFLDEVHVTFIEFSSETLFMRICLLG